MVRAQGAGRWSPHGWALPAVFAGLLLAALVVACGNGSHAPFIGAADPQPAVSGCSPGSEGCPCSTPGEQIGCGEVASNDGNQLVCLEGKRSCTNGVWSACSADRRVMKQASRSGSRWLALADAGAPCGNPCDPTCSEFIDTPIGLDPGPGFVVDEHGGLTLPGTGSNSSCRDIVLTPASATITVTRLDPLRTTPSNVAFSATCGVGGPPITPTWTLRPEDALIASVDPTGVFGVAAPIARDVRVTASSLDGQATATVSIVVDVTTSAAGCNAADFVRATGGVDPATTLYPYAVPARPVLFPLGLGAPLVQWSTGGVDARCVRVLLRYPAGSATPTFSWARIAGDGEDPREGSVDLTQPALSIAQSAWSAFDQSARGDAGEILVQRQRVVGSRVMDPMVIPVAFADDGLRGTVYYTQYTRRVRRTTCSASGQEDIDVDDPARETSASNGCQGGNCTGAGPVCPVGNCTQVTTAGGAALRALDLTVPAATPTDPFGGKASGCPVCHSVSADGRSLVADIYGAARSPTIAAIDRQRGSTTLAARADAPAYSLRASRSEPFAAPEREQSWGLADVAISPDGRFVLQGPNFWGNTSSSQTFAQGNDQDAGYGAGGKRYFLFDVDRFRSNVQLATDDPLESHTATPTALTSSVYDEALWIDGEAAWRGQTVLVKDEPIASENGLYTVESDGDHGYWRLVRLGDADEAGELVFGDKVLVESGDANFGKYFHVAGPPAGTITPGTTPISFALYTTVMAATVGPLPTFSVDDGDWRGRKLVGTGALSAEEFDGVETAPGMSVLVKDQPARELNGIYTLVDLEPWTLRRRDDANYDPELAPYTRVRVNQGALYGGHTFVLTTPGPVSIDGTELTFALDSALDEGFKLVDEGGAAAPLPTMMYPVFSPDGRSLAYVNGDRDVVAGQETGWRRGLSLLDFDASNLSVPFSNKRRLLDSYAGGTPARALKWPSFEADSRSLLFVETPASEFCPTEAYAGICTTPDCSATNPAVVNVDSDLERACFQAPNATGYGNGAPVVRGYWPGQLHAVNVNNAAESTLTWLNGGLASQSATFAADEGDAYQPNELAASSGGYRWVVFTSTRAYGNQLNAVGTHFSCAAPLLWMAAIDDDEAGASDRSHPAFLLPGQSLRSITDDITSRHYLNERAFLVPSPGKDVNETCTASSECEGGEDTPPRARCVLDPDSDPPVRRCQPLTACLPPGEACVEMDVCCSGVPCRDGVCLPTPMHQASVYRRTYTAVCPEGYAPRWGDFEWHADAESSSHIDFYVKVANSDDFGAATSVGLETADHGNANAPPAPAHTVNIDYVLQANELASGAYLQIAMDFRPSTDGTVAPILFDWNQSYDCVASE
jgi:hypothetical protein